MRKLLLIIGLCCSLILCSCQSTTEPSETESQVISTEDSNTASPIATPQPTATQIDTSSLSVSDFYPFNENKKYTYEGEGNEYASYTVYTDYTTSNRVQFRSNNGGTETVKVIEIKDGEIKEILSKSECYYRENFTTTKNTDGDVLLKEPLVIGTGWTLSDGSKRYISNTSAVVTTPLGTYYAIEVTTERANSKTYDYYAKDVGLVKTIYKTDETEISSTLSNIEDNVKFTQFIKFYYPNINDDKIYYVTKKLSFYTNDITKLMIQNAYKTVPSNLGKVLSTNTKINWLYLNSSGVLYVDFSKEFVSEMNAGSGYESMILQSVTNTLGEYYGVNNVYITVNNTAYSSGHIYKEKGESFKVNLTGTKSAD